MTLYVAPDRDVSLQGHYAGICTRLAAFVIDVLAIVFVYDVFVRAAEFLVTTLSGQAWQVSDLPVVSWLTLILWAIFYCTYPVTAGGRTFGMAIAGLRVVRPDGTAVNGRQALVRVIALPLSVLTFGIGFLLILLRPDSRALQDLIGGTAVVYGWDARAGARTIPSQTRERGRERLAVPHGERTSLVHPYVRSMTRAPRTERASTVTTATNSWLRPRRS